MEIQRDYECLDGEIGSPMDTFWTRGHGHDPEAVIRAAIELALESGAVPRIDEDDVPVEMWQQNVPIGDGIEYRRTKTRPEGRNHPAFPVTVLNLERRLHGGRGCSFAGCKEPWSCSTPIRVAVSPDPEYAAVEVHTCAEHRKMLPEPYYRVCLVPVGATVQLP